MVEAEGWRVYAATDADEAIVRLDRHGEGRVSVPGNAMPTHGANLAKPFDPAAMLCIIGEMTR